MEDDFYSPLNLWVHSICQLAELSYSPLNIGFWTALWVQGRAALWSSLSELCWSAHSLTVNTRRNLFLSSLPSVAWPRSSFCSFFSVVTLDGLRLAYLINRGWLFVLLLCWTLHFLLIWHWSTSMEHWSKGQVFSFQLTAEGHVLALFVLLFVFVDTQGNTGKIQLFYPQKHTVPLKNLNMETLPFIWMWKCIFNWHDLIPCALKLV